MRAAIILSLFQAQIAVKMGWLTRQRHSEIRGSDERATLTQEWKNRGVQSRRVGVERLKRKCNYQRDDGLKIEYRLHGSACLILKHTAKPIPEHWHRPHPLALSFHLLNPERNNLENNDVSSFSPQASRAARWHRVSALSKYHLVFWWWCFSNIRLLHFSICRQWKVKGKHIILTLFRQKRGDHWIIYIYMYIYTDMHVCVCVYREFILLLFWQLQNISVHPDQHWQRSQETEADHNKIIC